MSIIRQENINEEQSPSESPGTPPNPPTEVIVTETTSTTSAGDLSRTRVTSIGSVKTELQFSTSSSSSTSSSLGSTCAHEKRETVTHTVVGVGVTTTENDSNSEKLLATLQHNATIAMDPNSPMSQVETWNPKRHPEGCVTDDLLGFPSKEFNVVPDASKWLTEELSSKSDNITGSPNINAFLQGEIQRRDRMIEDLLTLNPLPAFPVKSIEGRVVTTSSAISSSADELRSELAAATVKIHQQEEDLRETRTSLSKKEGRLQELTRQLDAHRQEHARQAATIVSLRQRLQDECDMTSRLSGQQRRSELTLAALTRENKHNNDRILELESRLRTHLEERESAEQRSEASQKRLLSLLRVASSALSMEGELEPHDGPEKLSAKLGELVQECGHLRAEVSRFTEENCQLEESAGHARQTVTRLVNELDEQKVTNDEQRKFIDDIQKECDMLRSRARGEEEEVKSIRERLHSTNRSYNSTLEELHNAEKITQQAKDEALVAEHRRLQAETAWRGFLTTLSTLLSTATNKVPPDMEVLAEKVQSLVTNSKENSEQAERLSSHVSSLEEQNKRQNELYNAALKRARQADADAQSSSLRSRQLEAELTRSENVREHTTTERDKAVSLMSRVVDALGLKELGDEVTKDVELVVCRAQQLSRLEGEKIVDKTTTVYQLQRRLKSLREAVERKDLHVDMLRRKLSMVEEASRTSSLMAEERDEAVTRCRRQSRTIERLTGELNDARQQVRDLREQMADNSDDKAKLKQVNGKVEDLASKVNELDTLRVRQQKKISQLKEQVKAFGEHSVEERRVHDTSLDGLTQELAATKQALRDTCRREKQLSDFRRAVMELMVAPPGLEDATSGDLEVLARLERILSTHRELNDLSRRLDDLTCPSRPGSARPFANHALMHSHMRPSSPLRPSSAVPALHSHGSHGISSPSEYSIADFPPDDIHSLMDAAQNQRPNILKSRPSSARSRTPSPFKAHNTSDEEDVET